MKQSSKLSDFIFIEKSIPDTICDYILKELESNHWEKHQWGSIYGDAVEETEASKEPDITYSKPLDSILNSLLVQTGKRYEKKYSDESCINTTQFIFSLSEIRFNRYHIDQKMDMHFDHIKSLFDGSNPGIPALSFVGALNDDYEGGELVFWENYSVKLKKGEVICFPSNFLYQHRVNPILSGVRDTFVCWAW
jgi:predicted 2-oxoglutarate/Fe(II)-dependent dioxygenase YbiX